MVASPSVSERDKRWLKVLGTLNEGQARLFVAERALAEGRGGVSRLAQLTGMSRATITKGAAALQRRGRLTAPDPGRIRRPGGGRRRVTRGAQAAGPPADAPGRCPGRAV
jgi:hypothetical protein